MNELDNLDGEKIIIFHLMKNPAYFARVFSKLEGNNFKKVETKTIYQYIEKFHKKFEKSPSIKELALFVMESGLDKNLKQNVFNYIKTELKNEQDIKNFDFLIQFTQRHLKKISLMDAILESVDELKQKDDIENDIIVKFEKALNYNFDTDLGLEFHNDLENRFKKYQEEFRKISTGINVLDDLLGGGFRSKTLNLFLAPSHGGKCLRKDTKLNIYVDEKTRKKFEEWKRNKKLNS